ncbi:hypothetical protein AAY473_022232 [Plecturocebus cupreus]
MPRSVLGSLQQAPPGMLLEAKKQGLTLLPRLEYSGTLIAHYSLKLLDSNNPLTSASQVGGTTKSRSVTQGEGQWRNLGSLHPPAPGFKCPPPRLANFVFLVETRFHHAGQAGLELLTSGDPLISASQSVEITNKWGFTVLAMMVLKSWPHDPPASASQSARITVTPCSLPLGQRLLERPAGRVQEVIPIPIPKQAVQCSGNYSN